MLFSWRNNEIPHSSRRSIACCLHRSINAGNGFPGEKRKMRMQNGEGRMMEHFGLWKRVTLTNEN